MLSINLIFLNTALLLLCFNDYSALQRKLNLCMHILESCKYSNCSILQKLKSKFCLMDFLTLFCTPETVDVVQLVRTSDCGSEGRGFESHLPPKQIRLIPACRDQSYLFVVPSRVRHLSATKMAIPGSVLSV